MAGYVGKVTTIQGVAGFISTQGDISYNHETLINRNSPDQHNIGAITGLRTELDAKGNGLWINPNDNLLYLVDANGDPLGTGVAAGGGSSVVSGTINLTVAGWSGSDPYTQGVTISGTTANSKIDLQPDATVLLNMISSGISAMWAQNNNGTVTVYALGAAPSVAMSVQYTKTEVSS